MPAKTKQLKHARRLAAWVVANLPDSVEQQKTVLLDLANVFPADNEDGQKVLELRADLIAHETKQHELQLEFSEQ